jgi:predicted DNA-binding protein
MEEPQETETETVSTHVLVDAEQLERLRALARRTRISQSEYLREAVDNLLAKYEGNAADATALKEETP